VGKKKKKKKERKAGKTRKNVNKQKKGQKSAHTHTQQKLNKKGGERRLLIKTPYKPHAYTSTKQRSKVKIIEKQVTTKQTKV
jgi:hypothetical protein